jgi:RNA polymerase sigma factor FliA
MQPGRHSGREIIERPLAVEASLWRRLRFERQQSCRETLFNRFLSLARTIARGEFGRRPPIGLEKTDFEHLAYSGLLEAIDAFDPLRAVPFESYMRHRIRGAIADGARNGNEASAQYAARQRVERERVGSLSPDRRDADAIQQLTEFAVLIALGLMMEGHGGASTSQGARVYQSKRWQELEVALDQEVERLPDLQRSIVRQHYLNGVPFNQIARLLAVTPGRVSQVHRAALARLRDKLKGGSNDV